MMNIPPTILDIRRPLRAGNLHHAMQQLEHRVSRMQISDALRQKVTMLKAEYDRFVYARPEASQAERMSMRRELEDQLNLILNELECGEADCTRRSPEVRFVIGLLLTLIAMATIGLMMLSQGL